MFRWVLPALLLCLALLGWLAWPQAVRQHPLPDHLPDLANGELLFNAGGCVSCHGTLVDGRPSREHLGGGLQLATPVGIFSVPNISAHPVDGIGGWTSLQFINAMQRGVSPAGQHYYPAFPYTSYARMSVADVLDLQAWLSTLPAVTGRHGRHELKFPFAFRPALGPWKRLYLDTAPVLDVPASDAQLQRGRYLVEGPGHCGECHTPRTMAQAMDPQRWLKGGPSPDGMGRVPDLVDGLAHWSAADIAYYLETGLDPDFDVVGGHMAAVQENMSRLPAADRQAIAAYLEALRSRPAPAAR